MSQEVNVPPLMLDFSMDIGMVSRISFHFLADVSWRQRCQYERYTHFVHTFIMLNFQPYP